MGYKTKDTSLLNRMGSERSRELGEEVMTGILKKTLGSFEMKERKHERNKEILRRVRLAGREPSEEFMKLMEEEKLDYEKALTKATKKGGNDEKKY